MRKILSLLLGITMLLSVFGALSEGVDLNSYTLDEIIAKAKEEGHVESVGMPDSWANWGGSWKGLTATYGIAHTDEDMSSAEELSMFQNDFTRDIGDIGLGFITQALENDLVQGYKTTKWDSVPEWAKGEDGKWMIAYTGATSFIYNNDLAKDPMPASWEDVRKGSYKLTIGHVVGGATGQGVVVATAYAFGGDLDNFTFPRHDLDFTFLRAYENDKPAATPHHFKWSATGPKEDEFVIASGFPGSTARLMTVAQLAYARDFGNPLQKDVWETRRAALEQYSKLGPEQLHNGAWLETLPPLAVGPPMVTHRVNGADQAADFLFGLLQGEPRAA